MKEEMKKMFPLSCAVKNNRGSHEVLYTAQEEEKKKLLFSFFNFLMLLCSFVTFKNFFVAEE